MIEQKLISINELQKHNVSKDAWILYKDQIFDVTNYLDSHPGGRFILESSLGKDCTLEFDAANHSEMAKEIMQHYLIGKIDRVCADDQSKQFKATIIKKTTIGSRLAIDIELDKKFKILTGQHIAIKAIIKDQKVIRNYTPVNICEYDKIIKLEIKVYPNGLMTQYLTNLNEGDNFDIIGPLGAVFYDNKSIKLYKNHENIETLYMMGGGSGITPIVQILSNQDVMQIKNLIVYYSLRSFDDAICLQQLKDTVKENPNLQVVISYTGKDQLSSDIPIEYNFKFYNGRADYYLYKKYMVSYNNSFTLICGTENYNDYVLSECKSLINSDNYIVYGKFNYDIGKEKMAEWFWIAWSLSFLFLAINFVMSKGYEIFPFGYVNYGYGNLNFEIQDIRFHTGYLYKLKNPHWWHHVIPWIGFAMHALVIIVIMYMARTERPTYSYEMRWFNWWLLGSNFFFYWLKIFQTHMTYNGISSSSIPFLGIFTVVMYYIIVQAMYIPMRGLLFGYQKDWTLLKDLARWLREYHGYLIAVLICNDFWYHPFEGSMGHLSALLNEVLILWQSSMIYNHFHRHRLWTFSLEIIVLFHAPTIASIKNLWRVANLPEYQNIPFTEAYSLIIMVLFFYWTWLVANQMYHFKISVTFQVIMVLGLVSAIGYCVYESGPSNLMHFSYPIVYSLIIYLMAAVYWLFSSIGKLFIKEKFYHEDNKV